MICCEQQGTIIYHAKIRFHVFLVTIQQIRNGRESQNGLQLVGVSRKWQFSFRGVPTMKTKFTLQKVPSKSDSLLGNAEQAFNDMKFRENVSEK